MPRFFIERPIFAWVIAIVIMLGGVFAIETLPVEQYPQIAPPSVSIRANYSGASAEVLENSVTQVIEQSLTGIDNLRYFSSSSDSNGNMSISLTFEPGTDADIAQVQVQNKVSQVSSLLPQAVQQQGVVVRKSSSGFLMVVGVSSTDPNVSEYEIADYLNSNLVDPISRLNGVGTVNVFGAQKAMRIWLNPEALHSYSLMPSDIESAIKAQNVEVSSGQLGAGPAVAGQQLNATIKAMTKLQTVEQFEALLIKVKTDGSQVRLKDVARIELGAQSYSSIVRYKGMPASGIGVSLATGANALETAELVKTKVEELKAFMPAGYEVNYPYDSTPFVELSIHEVVKTLIEAIVLVFFVMFLFLQNFRATLIPTIAVPVVLLGTFGILEAAGYSINVLTMFAMVLAIGLLVDDAIVVVENVERIMSTEGLSPKEATKKSMSQITGGPGRDRPGSFRRFRADGLLRRFDGGDLPPVFDHYCLGNGPVGAGCADPDTGSLCYHAQADRAGTLPAATRLLRLVQSQLRGRQGDLSQECRLCRGPITTLFYHLSADYRRAAVCLSPVADLFYPE